MPNGGLHLYHPTTCNTRAHDMWHQHHLAWPVILSMAPTTSIKTGSLHSHIVHLQQLVCVPFATNPIAEAIVVEEVAEPMCSSNRQIGHCLHTCKAAIDTKMVCLGQVRKTVVEWLDGKGLLRGTQDNEMSVPFCSRSKDIIEPVLKPQWWVSCQGMAEDGMKAARDGSLQIIPSEFEATWHRSAHCLTPSLQHFMWFVG